MGKTSFFIVCASNAQHFHTCTTLIHMLMVMPVLIYASTPANSHSIKPANICSTIFRFTFVYIVISTLQTKILNHVFVPTDGFAWPFITNWIFDVLQTVCICIQVYARASVCVCILWFPRFIRYRASFLAWLCFGIALKRSHACKKSECDTNKCVNLEKKSKNNFVFAVWHIRVNIQAAKMSMPNAFGCYSVSLSM